MTTIRLTKSTTLALRMTEVLIENHLNTSLRMPVVRPIFQEIDFRFSVVSEENYYHSVFVTVSFLLDAKIVRMNCDCRIKKNVEDDWQPCEAYFSENTDKIEQFGFNQFGQLIINE